MKKIRLLAAAALLLCASATAFALPRADIARKPFAAPVLFEGLFGGDKKKAAPAPQTYYINDDASFEANTRTTHIRPYNNPSLEMDISLPANWIVNDLTKNQIMKMDQSILGDVATLQSEMVSVHRLNVTISTQTLNAEISAQNWLRYFLLTSGYALQAAVAEDGPTRASAYYTSIVDRTNVHTYVSAQITGNLVILSRFDVPLELKDFVAYVQKKVIDSIQLTYPREDTIEPQKSFALVDAVKFSYPVSWTPQNPDFKDMGRLSVQLQSLGPTGTIDGFLRIFAIRRGPETTLMKEIDLLKRHFDEFLGINLTRLTFSDKIPGISGRFVFSRYESYTAAYKKDGHTDPEVRLAVLGDKNWYVIAYLITPREQDNLSTWGHNIRSMELILQSLR